MDVNPDGMRISELSQASGESIATIKFYLREGILPPGRRLATNQAAYDEGHVQRLRLIRALVEVGRLPLATVREVLDAVDDPSLPLHQALGVAHRALAPDLGDQDDPFVADTLVEVNRFLDALGWTVSVDAPGRRELAVALATLRHLGWPDAGVQLFARYAEAADGLAAYEVERTTPDDAPRSTIVERAVIGTVVFDAVLSGLRRLAQERQSALRLRSEVATTTARGRSTRSG